MTGESEFAAGDARAIGKKVGKSVRIMLNLAQDDCAGLAGLIRLQDRTVGVRLNSAFPYRRICSG